jgi:hypothetical protein
MKRPRCDHISSSIRFQASVAASVRVRVAIT